MGRKDTELFHNGIVGPHPVGRKDTELFHNGIDSPYPVGRIDTELFITVSLGFTQWGEKLLIVIFRSDLPKDFRVIGE